MERKRNTELFDFYSKLVSGEGSNKRIRSGSVGHEPDISNEAIGSGVAFQTISKVYIPIYNIIKGPRTIYV